MNQSECEQLCARFGDRVSFDESLDRYTTYRIGGPAAALLLPATGDEVAEAISHCGSTGIPWIVLGLGSNVLIADEGFNGLVIRMGKGFDQVLERSGDGTTWRVQAGMPTPRLARQTAESGFSGIHRMVGIPGTVGGGVATNAGSHGQEYGQIVESVEVVRPDGTVVEMPVSEVAWRYREGVEGAAVTAATIRLEPGDRAALRDDIRRVNEFRKNNTPFDRACCGSVFKNPVDVGLGARRVGTSSSLRTAGQLIDAAGCKGLRVGAAEVSKLHANYIVNLGGATAAEVLAAIDAVRTRVLGEFGVELELEVRIIN